MMSSVDVVICTGDRRAAGTQAAVHIEVIGSTVAVAHAYVPAVECVRENSDDCEEILARGYNVTVKAVSEDGDLGEIVQVGGVDGLSLFFFSLSLSLSLSIHIKVEVEVDMVGYGDGFWGMIWWMTEDARDAGICGVRDSNSHPGPRTLTLTLTLTHEPSLTNSLTPHPDLHSQPHPPPYPLP